MYPYRPSRKIVAIVLVIAFLAAAFLANWKSSNSTALAKSYQQNDTVLQQPVSRNSLKPQLSIQAAALATVVEVRVSNADDDVDSMLEP